MWMQMMWTGLIVLTLASHAIADDAISQTFDQLHTQWTQNTKRLVDLQKTLRLADGDQRQQLLDEREQLLTQRYEIGAKLNQAALDAYRAAPNQNEQVNQVVLGLASDLVAADMYEQAHKIIQLLIDHQHPSKKVTNLAGITSFAMHDFNAASRYFTIAKHAGSLDRLGQQLAAQVESYRGYWETEQKIRAAEQSADDLPRVKMSTNRGDIVIELFENEAPNTVANFIHLVEGGFYDGLTFHRVLANFMAQGGCPRGDGTAGPGWAVPCECYRKDFRRHFRGSLSMAHAGRDTGGSQFFLTFMPTPHLDSRHTVFGRVIDGLDVLAKLKRRDPQRGGPNPDRIVKATVLRKRSHTYPVTKKNARR